MAFLSENVLMDLGASTGIETMTCMEDTLIVSLTDGSILFLERTPPSPGEDKASTSSDAFEAHAPPHGMAPSWQVTRAHRPPGAGSRGEGLLLSGLHAPPARTTMRQMEAINAPKPVLLALMNEGLMLYTLPDLQLRFQASRTASASCFAWHAQGHVVAVAVKRRVLLFRLSGNDLVAAGEGSLPDAALCMLWARTGSLFVGCKRGYLILKPLESSNPGIISLSPPLEILSIPPAPSGLISPQPCMALTGDHEVLLSIGSAALFFTPMGQPSPTRPHLLKAKSESSSLPSWIVQLGCSPHYVLSVEGQGCSLMARSLLRVDGERIEHQLVSSNAPNPPQGDSQPNLSAPQGRPVGSRSMFAPALTPPLSSSSQKVAWIESDRNGSCFVALSSSCQPSLSFPSRVVRVWEQSIQDQATQLAREGEFYQSLALAALVRDGPESKELISRSDLEHQLRLMMGHSLFAQGEFDQGIAQMEMCSGTNALLLLRLLPTLVSPGLHELLPSFSERGTELPPVEALSSSEDQITAATAMLPYLTSHRTRLLNSGGAEDGEERPPSQSQERVSSSGRGIDKNTMLKIIDTAIVKIMVLMTDTGALLRFVQSSSQHIILEEAIEVLAHHGMYAELAALYRSNGRHDDGLELMRCLSQEPETLPVPPRGAAADLPGLTGVWAAVRYLVVAIRGEGEGTEGERLIRKHAAWILRADPEAGLQAFLQMRPPLSPALVLSILSGTPRDLSALYLEAALHMGLALPQEYHNDLLLIYLEELLSQQSSFTSESNILPGDLERQTGMSLPGEADRHEDEDTSNLHLPRLPLHMPLNPQGAYGEEPSSRASGPQGKLFPDDVPCNPSSSQALASQQPLPHETSPPYPPSSPSHHVSSASPFHPLSPHVPFSTSLSATSCGNQGGMNPWRDLYRRLRHLAYTSPYIDPSYIIERLPTGRLLEVRALMLERLSRYPEALSVLVKEMEDLDLAESLCSRVYLKLVADQNDSSSSTRPISILRPQDIYVMLLESFVSARRTSPSSKLDWNRLSWLLSRKRHRIDAKNLLLSIPNSVPLSDLLPLIQGLLSFGKEQRRELEVMKQLRKADTLHTRNLLIEVQRRQVLHTSERVCSVCFRKLGGSSLVVACPLVSSDNREGDAKGSPLLGLTEEIGGDREGESSPILLAHYYCNASLNHPKN